MPKVSDLSIKLQTGTDNTYYASWTFNETKTTNTASSSGIKKGSLVSIKSGATYYNGVAIPSWVKNDKWYVTQVKGDRAVLGKNQSGSNNINSPVNVKYLSASSSSSSGSGTTTEEIKNLDYYEIKWYYDTGDGVWFEGNTGTTKNKYATYDPPENSLKIKIWVKPISKTYQSGGKEVSYWTGTSNSVTLLLHQTLPPEEPPTPTVSVEKLKMTVLVENISDEKSDKIEFEIYDGTTCVHKKVVDVLACMASYIYTMTEGGKYRVRCRAIKMYNETYVYGEYSDFTSEITTIPPATSGITECRASSTSSVYLSWESVSGATAYDIEYATKSEYFDGSDQTTVISSIEYTHYELVGLEIGTEYFFRLRAVNDNGTSAWSEPVSVILGKNPSAPTTWSSSTTVIVGEPLTLYWVHNSEDGSSQKYADLELYVDGHKESHQITNSTDEDEKDKTSHYEIDTSDYTEGTKLEWRVRTAGVTNTYGDWSVQRTVDIYARPTMNLSVINSNGNALSVINSFPFYISALTGPNTQAPLGYHLSIKSKETYEGYDHIGNSKIVSQGDEVYSKFFDITDSLMVEMSAGNVDLQNNIHYTVTCVASMNSGLTVEESLDIEVEWTDLIYEPDAEIGIDSSNYSAILRPYCVDEDGNLIEDAILSVYRREYDGSFTEIATGITNIMNTYVTDPHPALDYARYRIVAISETNGGIGFYDMPPQPVDCGSIVIQWDERWVDFDSTSEDEREQPTWTGSMLVLPYNIDTSESTSKDKTLVSYIGRANPVSYYGTHIGEGGVWNCDVPKTDIETIYALRRLSKWKDDVYVREPSGVGYWASIDVSFSQKHTELVYPITLSVTRVEGGM